MKSNIQFILSMIIFGTIGLIVRYIDLSSSETALLSSSIGCLFLVFVFFVMKTEALASFFNHSHPVEW